MSLHVSTGKIITFPCGCHFEEYDDGGTGNFNWRQCRGHLLAERLAPALEAILEEAEDREDVEDRPSGGGVRPNAWMRVATLCREALGK